MSRRELAKGTVRPGSVVVPKIPDQHLVQMVLIDDQQPVEELLDRTLSWNQAHLLRILRD